MEFELKDPNAPLEGIARALKNAMGTKQKAATITCPRPDGSRVVYRWNARASALCAVRMCRPERPFPVVHHAPRVYCRSRDRSATSLRWVVQWPRR